MTTHTEQMDHHPADLTKPAPAERSERAGRTPLVIKLLVAATFVVILNETIMTNAIPVLMGVLHIDARAAQWLSTGFMLTMAVVIPTTGWLLQRIGRRNAFLAAMDPVSEPRWFDNEYALAELAKADRGSPTMPSAVA